MRSRQTTASNRLAALVSLLIVLAACLAYAQADQNPSPFGVQVSDTIRRLWGKTAPVKGALRVTSEADKLIITVGDIIRYTMKVEAPAGSEVAIPPPGAQLGEFLIRNYNFPKPKETKEGVVQEFQFDITAYSTGELVIPAFPVVIKDPSGASNVLIAEAIRIRVAAVTKPEDLEVRDVKAPLNVPINYVPYIIAAVCGVLIVTAAVLLILYFRRWRHRELPAPAPIRAAHELAYEELNALYQMGLLEKGEIEAFYTRLSEIIRRYIALRWKMYALEYTSTEILSKLREKSLTSQVFERIRWFLEETDLVKFAQFIPPDKDRKEVFERTRAIVDWTRERETLIEDQSGSLPLREEIPNQEENRPAV